MKGICRGFHFTSYYTSFQTKRVHSKWVRLYLDKEITILSVHLYMYENKTRCPKGQHIVHLSNIGKCANEFLYCPFELLQNKVILIVHQQSTLDVLL